MMRRRKGSRGFTIVECVVAVAVGMTILGAVYAAVWTGQRSATGIDRKVTTGQDARAALEVMAMEMRMASYNPFYAANPWTDITNCNAGDATRRGVQNAASSTIQIQMDLNGGGKRNHRVCPGHGESAHHEGNLDLLGRAGFGGPPVFSRRGGRGGEDGPGGQ
jgi:Tfp pilus assembly protein PilW